MAMFWKLLEQSTITSGIIALIMVGTACYALVMGIELPEFFSVALGTILGYFFSEKAGKARLAHLK